MLGASVKLRNTTLKPHLLKSLGKLAYSASIFFLYNGKTNEIGRHFCTREIFGCGLGLDCLGIELYILLVQSSN